MQERGSMRKHEEAWGRRMECDCNILQPLGSCAKLFSMPSGPTLVRDAWHNVCHRATGDFNQSGGSRLDHHLLSACTILTFRHISDMRFAQWREWHRTHDRFDTEYPQTCQQSTNDHESVVVILAACARPFVILCPLRDASAAPPAHHISTCR